jgi:hypothetical protein
MADKSEAEIFNFLAVGEPPERATSGGSFGFSKNNAPGL